MTASRADDTGAFTAMVAVLGLSFLALAGLVYDGGQILATRREAHNAAQQAARAGAQAISIDDARRGVMGRLDAEGATAAAHDYLREAGLTGEVAVDGERVTVTVRLTEQMDILQIVGIDAVEVESSASSRALVGVSRAEN